MKGAQMRKTQVVAVAIVMSVMGSAGLFAAPTPAQGLIQKAPDQTLALAATSGGAYLKADFNQSILGRLWYDPGMQNFYNQLKPVVLGLYEKETAPEDKATAAAVFELARLVLQRPILAGASQLDKSPDETPAFAYLFLDAGPQKAEIARALERVMELFFKGKTDQIIDVEIAGHKLQGPKDPEGVPGYWGWVGNYYVFAVNDPEGRALKNLNSPAAPSPAARTLARVQGADDAWVFHGNVQQALFLFGPFLQKDMGAQDYGKFQTMMQSLGITDIKTINSRIGFAGPDLLGGGLIETRPEGIFKLLRPVDLADFDLVDGRASEALAFNFDFAGGYDLLTKILSGTLPPADFEKFVAATALFEALSGSKLEEFLGNIAGPMLGYAVPAGAVVGSSTSGFVGLVPVKDPNRMEDCLGKLEALAETQFSQQMKGMFKVNIQEMNGVKLHSWVIAPLALMQISPCWALLGDKLAMASNTSTFFMAREHLTAADMKSKSLRANPKFQQVTQNLPRGLISLQFSDTQIQFRGMVAALQQFWPMASMLAAQQVKAPLPTMAPDFSGVIPDMGPAVSYAWFDAAGLHSQFKGPLPTSGNLNVGSSAMLVSILMPALSRARELANQAKCAGNLRTIITGIHIYANDHRDELPKKLGDMVKEGDLTEDILMCPDKKSPGSYIYRGNDLTVSHSGNMIVVHDGIGNHDEYRNVAFLMGAVKQVTEEEFQELIARDNELRKKAGLTEKPADPESPAEEAPTKAPAR